MYVHRSNRVEVLVDVLSRVAARPLLDPLCPEVVVVQSRGMERWLSLQLADRLGVWANARFPFPRRALHDLSDAVTGPVPEGAFTWRPAELLWAIAAELPARLGEPGFGALRGYLADDRTGLKRLQIAAVIAQRFDQYATYRPDLVLSWEAGAEQGAWQPTLWRALARKHGSFHVARRASDLVAALASGTEAAALPERLQVFGISTLPPLYLRALDAVGDVLPVHLYLLSPSREYWADVKSTREISRRARRLGRSPDELHLYEGNPLLASMGLAGRDFQRVLERDAGDYIPDALELYVDAGTDTALHVLQADILHLRTRGLPDTPALPLDPEDRSVSLHSCHGPMREVEVLRDQLRAAFDELDDLEPADVVVLAADVERYAPLVDAVFGVASTSGSDLRGAIPYRIADRTVRADSAVVDAFLNLVALLDSRMPAPAVLDALASAPVAQRFELSPEDLLRIEQWVRDTGIRWGVDGAHRSEAHQPGFEENTWRFGLRRMVLGAFVPGDDRDLFGGVLPYDEIEGEAVGPLAKLVAFTEALFAARKAARGTRTAGAWVELLTALADATITTADDAAWHNRLLRDALGELASDAARAGHGEALDLGTVRWWLERRFTHDRSSHGFATRGITFCAMLPMRSVPFRVVCVLGMDDTAFPRSDRSPAFDLLGADPQPADRSVRAEDRYLFLETLLSARDRLVITWVGRSHRDNKELPPSVVVSELMDVLDASLTHEEGPASAALHHEHPLQPFSPRYFGQDPTLFSYEEAPARGARALAGAAVERPAFLPGALPVEDRAELTLYELQAFFGNPARALLAGRLGVKLAHERTPLQDREPLVPDALERYLLAAPLLEAALHGEEPDDVWPAARASGAFPPGVPGRCVYEDLFPAVREVADAARPWLAGARLPPVEVDLEIALRDGTPTRLTGWLDAVWPTALVHRQYARVAAHHELQLWVRHLALCCIDRDGLPRQSVLVGRHPTRPGAGLWRFTEPDDAHYQLSLLVRLFWYAQGVAVPLFPGLSRTYAEKVPSGKWNHRNALRKLSEDFTKRRTRDGTSDPYVAMLFEGLDVFDPAYTPAVEEVPHFGKLATLLFEPLLKCREEVRP